MNEHEADVYLAQRVYERADRCAAYYESIGVECASYRAWAEEARMALRAAVLMAEANGVRCV